LSDENTSEAEGTLGAMANWIKKPFTSGNSRGRLLVVVGTYSIGKERIVIGIAKALGTKIYASSGKRRICACLEDDELMSLITEDPKEAQVHMTRFPH
jgi:DNA cross-link repair 1A protein